MQYTPISYRCYELKLRAECQRCDYAHDYVDFFLYYRFSFVFITDSRIFSVGDTVWVCRRGSLKSAVTRPARRWIQGVFEAIPNPACLLVLQHFCTKDTKCAARLTYSQFSAFWKCPHRKTSTSHISNPCNLIPLLHPKNGSRHGPGTGQECFVKTERVFTDFLLELVTARGL